MRNIGATLLVLLLLSVAAASARASLIAFDPFLVGGTPASGEYYVGDLSSSHGNQNPTVLGFVDPWFGATGTIEAVSAGLSYPNMGVAGGAARFRYTVSLEDPRRVGRDIVTAYDQNRGVYYMSGLMSFDSSFGTNLFGGTNSTQSTAYTGILNQSDANDHSQNTPNPGAGSSVLVLGPQWGFQGDGAGGVDAMLRLRATNGDIVNQVLEADIDPGEHLWVMRIDPDFSGAYDRITVWFDPADVFSEATAGTPTLQGNYSYWTQDGISTRLIDSLRFQATNVGANAAVGYDQIAFGETWEDAVNWVPEPATWTLCLLGGVPLLLRRRRRHAAVR